jgi:uncharacterized RDD family membrane protein YckC
VKYAFNKNKMNNLYFPRLIKRVLAIQIDSIIMVVAGMSSLIIGDSMGVSSMTGKIMIVAIPIFLLEPGLIALTGATIGHRVNGIKVVKKNGTDKINIFASTLRFVVKVTFGAFSYIFLFTTKRHQAIHDLVARSIVVHRDIKGLPQYDLLQERDIEETGFVYPSAWKRVIGIMLYLTAAVLFSGFAVGLAVSDKCTYDDRCYGAELLIRTVFSWAMLLAFGAIIVMGWKGRLLGFRRKSKAPL